MSWLKKWRLPHLYSVRRTLTLCVEEQVGGGIAYTCVWELSWASAYEGFLLPGSDTGQRRFSHLGPDVLHMVHIPGLLTLTGLSCQVPGLFLPALQAVQSCKQKVQHSSQCSHSSVSRVYWGEVVSFMVSCMETTKTFLGTGNLPGSCHQSLPLD